jgi:8-oxo-dGTP diphosphatase
MCDSAREDPQVSFRLLLVAAVALIDADGRVLIAQRPEGKQLAGRWEFPGGKVEPDESPEAALVREIAEELGVEIELTQWLDGAAPIGSTHMLTVALARIVAGDPEPTEHDRIRWLTAAELDDVDWLEPDRPFLPELQGTMGQ